MHEYKVPTIEEWDDFHMKQRWTVFGPVFLHVPPSEARKCIIFKSVYIINLS